MKMFLLLTVLVSQMAFAQEQVSPGFDGTDGPNKERYPTQEELKEAVKNHPALQAIKEKYQQENPQEKITDVRVFNRQKDDVVLMTVHVNHESKDGKYVGWMTLCARVDYTDVGGRMDGHEAVKIADILAFISFKSGGCQ